MTNLKTLIIKIYLPAALYEIAIGAITPMIAVAALNLNANISVASIVASMLGIGQIVGDIPAGKLATIFGDKMAMIYGALASFICLIICFLANNYFYLGVGIFLIGAINAVFLLARQSYVIEIAPDHLTSRALSGLGGMSRIGLLLGPFLGSFTISIWGLKSIYILSFLIVILTLLVLFIFKDPAVDKPKRRKIIQTNISTFILFKRYKHIFLTLGLAVLLVGAIRSVRQVGIPLWAQSQGISDGGVSFIFALSSFFDVLLFYPSAIIMDKWGRLWSSVPSMLIMVIGLMVLPFTHDFISICLAGAVIGVGNGLGTGIIMTLAADIAPARYRSNFLGLWRIYGDLGNALGPVFISLGASILALGPTLFLSSIIGLVASILLLVYLPKFSSKANLLRRL
ncbi:MAG: MFS transporter [Bifidobacteriaceae bacterium]|nr:MFS transporter [Bifidobacteriaceae bacterium]